MFRKISGRLSLLIACWAVLLGASSPQSLEYEVKAVYIYKLLKFVEWPEGLFSPDRNTVVIGIIGDSPIREAIETLKHSHSAPIQVVRLTSLREIGSINVLFISASARESLEDILHAAAKARCLTISESNGSSQSGAMINFVIDDEKVKFEINMKTMKDAGLAIGSRVLRSAVKVW